jgi:hypothetical protein
MATKRSLHYQTDILDLDLLTSNVVAFLAEMVQLTSPDARVREAQLFLWGSRPCNDDMYELCSSLTDCVQQDSRNISSNFRMRCLIRLVFNIQVSLHLLKWDESEDMERILCLKMAKDAVRAVAQQFREISPPVDIVKDSSNSNNDRHELPNVMDDFISGKF